MKSSIIITKKPIKTLRMTIKQDGTVLVSAPKNCPDQTIQQRVTSKQQRIEKTHQRLQKKSQRTRIDDNQCLLFGEVYTISQTHRAGQDRDPENNLFFVPEGKTSTERLRTIAPIYLKKKCIFRADHHHCTINKVFIRSQTTKRGTCSSKKNIGLNRKLITLPERIIDYVICHELAHLTHMNHSKNFRNHCAALYPKTQEAKKWMKEYGYMVG